MRKISLDGAWRLAEACLCGGRQAGKGGDMPAAVPGCVHLDLLAAGKIPDPFHRDNESRLQWIGEADWVYSRAFEAPDELLECDRVLLRCEGLDTLATITLNGRRLARTENMFRTWEFDVSRSLRPGRNEIEVRFDSTFPYMKKHNRKRPLAVGWAAGGGWIRKEPCNYGWDWGPKLATCGIWRPISLVGIETARLADIRVTQDHSKRSAVGLEVACTVERAGARASALSAAVTVLFKGKTVAREAIAFEGDAARACLVVKNPELWWPNGLGGQPLYDLTVELLDADGRLLDYDARRIGLRTLRLEREKDRWGESFRFVANGVPFFVKGANWIPADAFAPRVTRDHYRRLLASAREANMNMLRSWGGGIYEADDFYDICDELGLCVWQDFIFACGRYPAFDPAWMANVAAEAADNVRRFRHHASLALWCGNNELEQGAVGEKWTDWQMSWSDYGKLFDEMLPRIVAELDPQRQYWPGSPHTPHGDRKDFNNPTCGDAHLWDVWHGGQPFEWYRTAGHRFVSEFGFQAFPEPLTVRGFTAPEDRNVTSPVMEHHQRHGAGNGIIMRYMLDWFRLPGDFEKILWLSQVLQGLGIKYAVEHWRRSRPRTMGAIYWQLDDCWPVASWSSLDSHGRWKALHYMARRFYAPVLVSGVERAEAGKVEVHVTNDLLEPAAAELAWLVTSVTGEKVASGREAVRAPAAASKRVATLDLSKHLAARGARDLMVWLDLSMHGRCVSNNFVSFARPKQMELADPGISAKVKPARDGGFAVTLQAKKPALWAWLELADTEASYSDNFFHLAPGRQVEVTVRPAGPLTPAQFNKRLVVRSLVDTYSR